ncbi:TipJ family phage tail tip protein [Iodobacter fluviatilis]|uniref:Uncharacterized protein n=1 Tax=Iodobacter fluviatilis TaxID=537 RepID=A0A7G3GBA1_9NEIS|nr:phage tail protein [Iodobacter fluviatilis]QBC44469.1 hypothetical protein C1H71_13625 [Iodobacter fluviatilis]
MSARDIIGAGGGGKGGDEGGRTPVEAPDSLRSRDLARVLDLISEGEIQGLVNGMKSIYLNEVPLQDPSGNPNFTGITVDTRTGTQSQGYIPGIPAVENEIQVGAEVKVAVPLVRSIISPSVNAVRVRLSFPNLSAQNTSNGDLNGTAVEVAIDVQSAGGPWVEKKRDTIRGKAVSKYVRSYRVELTGAAPWQVRVRRITPDSALVALQNKTFWESYTEIIDAKLRYPNSALVALSVDSSQFNSIPTRAYHMRGLIIQVPSNYDPVARTYNGIWNGSFKPAYSNNPAWVFYDLVLNSRYGLGQFIPASSVDKWALYEIARYCDEKVATGFGGTEPRFTCNVYLQTRQDAYRVLQDLASVFRGISFWAAGSLFATQDAPADAEAQFTNANVIDGRFEYQGASASSRHTVALVTWNDPDNMYRPQIEYVADDEGIRRFGVRQAEIAAIGCTSRGQAHRLGRWLLYSEAMESEVVSFKCGLDGAFILPGTVIKVSDRLRKAKRAGGRIVSATASKVTVDSYEALGGVERLTVVQPNGTLAEGVVIGVVGNVLTLQNPLPFVPVPQAVWILASDTVPEVLYRVVSIAETEPGQIAVTALLHMPDKYARVEQNLRLEPVKRPPAAVIPAAPAVINFAELLQNDAEKITVKLLLSWDMVQGAREYRVRWRFGAGNWSEANPSDASYEIRDVPVGLVDVEVGSVGAMGVSARMTAASYTMQGDSAPPAAVIGLTLIEPFAGNGLRAKWNRVPRATGYTVELRTTGGVLIRQLFIGDVAHFEYLAESMLADGGPWRSVTLKVRAENTRAQPGPWSSLLATNPVPAALNGLLMTAGYDAVLFSCAAPADLDFKGLKVWASANTGFSTADDTFLVYDGPNTQVPITTLRSGQKLAGGVPVYVRAAAYDAFGKTGLNISSELACTPLKLLEGLKPGEIDSVLIKAVDAAKIAGTLQDWQIEGQADLKARVTQAVQDLNGKASIGDVSILEAKLAKVGSSSNMLINADFLSVNDSAVPLLGWQVGGDSVNLARGHSLSNDWQVLPATAAKTAYLHTLAAGGSPTWVYQTHLVEAGKTYCFSVFSGAHRARCWVSLEFLDATGKLIPVAAGGAESINLYTGDASNSFGGALLSGYKRIFLLRKAPVGAVKVNTVIGKDGTLPPFSDSWHFFTRAMFEGVTEGAAGPSEWRTGQTAVDGISASVTEIKNAQAALDGKVSSKWGVVLEATTDGRKKLSGVQAFNDGSVSQFIISADQVLITSGGEINPDPNFSDKSLPGTWVIANGVGAIVGPSSWDGAEGNYFRFDTPNTRIHTAKAMPINPSHVYRLTAALGAEAGSDRNMYVYIIFYDAAGVEIAPNGWGGALSGYTHGGLVSGGRFTRYGAQFGLDTSRPIPSNARLCRIGVWGQYSGGGSTANPQYCCAVRLERAFGAELIVDGSITAKSLKVDTLQSVNARTGNLIVDGGGSICSSNFSNYWSWPAAGQTGFHISERGMLLGNPNYGNGSFFHYDVLNGNLEVRNGTIRASAIEACEVNLKSKNAGQGYMQITNQLITVFDGNGVRRVDLGIF